MPPKRSDIPDIVLKENSVIISDNLIALLHVSPGDRIAIGYLEKEGNLVPIISKSESGNKLNKSNTFAFRGLRRNILNSLGSRFWAKEVDGNIELEGDGIPIYTEVKKAADAVITKEIIKDTNYNITKLENYEF